MRDHRGGDQIVYGAVRVLMLLGVAGALAADWLDVPSDRYAFILYLMSWILLTSGLLFAVEWGGALVMALVQIGDIAVLGYLTVNNGGNASPLAFLLLPHVIAMAIFVSRPLALFVTVALVLFHGYLLHLAGAMGFYAAGFWTAYGAALLAGAFCFMAVKNIQRYVLQYAALEDREKYLERSLTALEQKLDQSTVVDAVTGLNNFRYFRDRIDKEVKRAKRQKYIFSLCILSVDDLEVFDKRYGAAERDLALAEMGAGVTSSDRRLGLARRCQEIETELRVKMGQWEQWHLEIEEGASS